MIDYHYGNQSQIRERYLKTTGEIGFEGGKRLRIEIKRRDDVLKYAGMLRDLSDREMELFLDVTKRRKLFGSRKLVKK